MDNKKIEGKISRLRKRAKKMNMDFDLTMVWMREKIENTNRCEVTNILFDNTIFDNGVNPWYPSIDRIDSSKGYTKDNCQVVVMIYNLAKGEWDEDVFKKWSRKL